MPGFNIHIAVAKQYMKKHEGEIKNEKEFLDGTIRPDMEEDLVQICKDKTKTHYGNLGYKNDGTFETNFDEFLEDEKVDISKDFYKGYLLHLLTDYYFYNKYFNKELLEVIKNNDLFHYDFDCTNKMLEDKYDIVLSDNLKKFTGYSDGKPKYINPKKLLDFIEEVSSISLEKQIKSIRTCRNCIMLDTVER